MNAIHQTALRSVYADDHEAFRDQVRKFMETEVKPFHAQWEKDGQVDKAVWRKAGEMGMLCCDMPEEYGGIGVDFGFNCIVMEEVARAFASGLGFSLHTDIVAPYILNYGTEEQKLHWLPKMASGEIVTAIAMTEPGAGSDLQGIRTTAVRDGDDYVINGSKTFITNGQLADLVIVVAKTNPEEGAKGTSLILVEADRDGFEKGQNLEKLGMKAQDTSELFFNDVRVPAANLLGSQEGLGFIQLMQELPRERLTVGIAAVAAMEAVLAETIAYCKERKAFGKPIIGFQNTKFKLAEMKTLATVSRSFLNDCIEKMLAGELTVEEGAMCKYWLTDQQNILTDECLQLFGGYGFMWEYPVCRAYADARVQRIYAGTNEIMKELISRSL